MVDPSTLRSDKTPEKGSRPDSSPDQRSRVLYSGLLLLTVTAGLLSRRFPAYQPVLIARYSGDALWAAMVFFGLALIYRRARTVTLSAAAVAIAWAVELSQLYHARWIDTIRATRTGSLVLGQGFLWSDLVMYVVGVGLAAIIDRALHRLRQDHDA